MKKTGNGITEMVFILDRSGSMSGLEADTVGGFNSMIEKQRTQEGEAYVSVVLFDDRSEVIYDRVKLSEIRPMTRDDYFVRGCTALYDALGGAYRQYPKICKKRGRSRAHCIRYHDRRYGKCLPYIFAAKDQANDRKGKK